MFAYWTRKKNSELATDKFFRHLTACFVGRQDKATINCKPKRRENPLVTTSSSNCIERFGSRRAGHDRTIWLAWTLG